MLCTCVNPIPFDNDDGFCSVCSNPIICPDCGQTICDCMDRLDIMKDERTIFDARSERTDYLGLDTTPMVI